MDRLLLAGVSAALLGLVYTISRRRGKQRKHGRAALAADDQQFARPATTGGVSQRIAKARANCFGRQTFEKLSKEAAELSAKGAFWSDPLFTHDDSSLFIDASRPPEDWLDGSVVIKGERPGVRFKFCTALTGQARARRRRDVAVRGRG